MDESRKEQGRKRKTIATTRNMAMNGITYVPRQNSRRVRVMRLSERSHVTYLMHLGCEYLNMRSLETDKDQPGEGHSEKSEGFSDSTETSAYNVPSDARRSTIPSKWTQLHRSREFPMSTQQMPDVRANPLYRAMLKRLQALQHEGSLTVGPLEGDLLHSCGPSKPSMATTK